MIVVARAADLAAYTGQKLGVSDRHRIDQAQIDAFARATGDDHWIHVDVERARREMPDGKTIAHGLYTLSLSPLLARSIYRIEWRGRGLNYGYNRVRFTGPVPVGSRVRLQQSMKAVEVIDGGTRITTELLFEVEGVAKPVLVAEHVLLILDV